MPQDDPNDNDIDLHPWPLSPKRLYVTKRTMRRKAFAVAILLICILAGLVLWMSWSEPTLGVSHEARSQEMAKVTRCCLQDIRGAQEALTQLAIDTQKLAVRFKTDTSPNGERTGQKNLSIAIASLEEDPRRVWDQLESLLDGSTEKRRQIRDIRIKFEGLKEHMQVIERCCDDKTNNLPHLRKHLESAEHRFQTMASKISPTYVEGELNMASATADSGYSYALQQDFDTPADSVAAPTISKMKIYENGVELGPAHAAHQDIRRHGGGRFSHWGNNTLYFSSSDNSDPKTNKRIYTYRIYSGAIPSKDATELDSRQ